MLETKFNWNIIFDFPFLKWLIAVLWFYCAIHLIPLIVANEQSEVMPGEPIRVVANSNTKKDQQVKQQIVAIITEQAKNTSVAQVDTILQNNVSNVDYTVIRDKVLLPPKWIGHSFYPQGYYEMTVVKIGNARGNNWFCSLFYYACGMDKKNMSKSSVSFFKKWWKK